MKILTYLKIILSYLIGIIIVEIVLALLGLAISIWTIYDIIKNILSFIFHPIKFFKEKEKPKNIFESNFIKSFKNGFMDGLSSNNKETLQ